MPRPLNFQQIQAFKTVMETGTTTKAALALNTTQPSISRRLSELQSATGLQLFDLYNGRLRPTREGSQLYQSVRKHFDGLEKIESAVQILRKSGTGVLRIGSTPTLAAGLLPDIIARFMHQHPGVYVNLQTLGTPQLTEYLRQDLLDFVLTTGTIEQNDIVSSRLMRANAVCVVPREHALAKVDYVDLESLHTHKLLLLNDTDDIILAMRALLRDRQYPDDIAIETNSSITICSLVAAGVGVGVVNPFVANSFADRLAIKQLRPHIGMQVTLARSVTLAPSLLANRFVQQLQESVRRAP
ncbi:LysR family transcriptional regulator [Allopusillimonas ginsengisoli]|uniref:LysR family transcriptional regulator n=1 Tax=Allopusillimonas ginsengisoli TaxID=453575 RepID=UPI001021B7E7|nr:LysR substrate-binding domain-containing protein [Allopusillimonas ginsengisoli]TEA78310.1 LysR family transcriptional regulator [Allopusillimonas ginsengisoli]